jgi:hypothetical protein
LYTKVGIQEAITAYKAVCEVDVESGNEYYDLSFRNVDESVKDVLLDEFNNYALYSTIARKKTW